MYLILHFQANWTPGMVWSLSSVYWPYKHTKQTICWEILTYYKVRIYRQKSFQNSTYWKSNFPMIPHVCPMVGQLVHRLVVMFLLEAGKLHFYAPIGVLTVFPGIIQLKQQVKSINHQFFKWTKSLLVTLLTAFNNF